MTPAGLGAGVQKWFAQFPEMDLASRSRKPAALAAGAAQGFSGPSGMRVELFGRAGLFAAERPPRRIRSGSPAGREGFGESISATRLVSEVGWGGGARLMSGNWGVEGTYSIFESLALSPSWLVI